MYLSDKGVANAKMPCGHVISIEGMTGLIKMIIAKKELIITCPGFD